MPELVEVTEQTVLVYRRRFAAHNSTLTVGQIVKETGQPRRSIRSWLTGTLYSHVPEAVAEHVVTRRNEFEVFGLTDEQVLEMRRRFMSDEEIWSVRGVAQEYKISWSAAEKILKGYLFKHVPGIVSEVDYKAKKHQRAKMKEAYLIKMLPAATASFDAEVILFMRLVRQPKNVTIKQIAAAHRISEAETRRVINGRARSDVPMPLPVPEAPPVALVAPVAASVHRPRRIIPIRPVRLLDHDTRVDQVALARSRGRG